MQSPALIATPTVPTQAHASRPTSSDGLSGTTEGMFVSKGTTEGIGWSGHASETTHPQKHGRSSRKRRPPKMAIGRARCPAGKTLARMAWDCGPVPASPTPTSMRSTSSAQNEVARPAGRRLRHPDCVRMGRCLARCEGAVAADAVRPIGVNRSSSAAKFKAGARTAERSHQREGEQRADDDLGRAAPQGMLSRAGSS
jgi:hypothetical protein